MAEPTLESLQLAVNRLQARVLVLEDSFVAVAARVTTLEGGDPNSPDVSSLTKDMVHLHAVVAEATQSPKA